MPRVRSNTIVGNPPGAAETVVCQITPAQIPIGLGGDPVDLTAFVDITAAVGTTQVVISIERGTVAGGTVLGLCAPQVAGNIRVCLPVQGTDQETNTGYVLTATVNGAGGASVINRIMLRADW